MSISGHRRRWPGRLVGFHPGVVGARREPGDRRTRGRSGRRRGATVARSATRTPRRRRGRGLGATAPRRRAGVASGRSSVWSMRAATSLGSTPTSIPAHSVQVTVSLPHPVSSSCQPSGRRGRHRLGVASSRRGLARQDHLQVDLHLGSVPLGRSATRAAGQRQIITRTGQREGVLGAIHPGSAGPAPDRRRPRPSRRAAGGRRRRPPSSAPCRVRTVRPGQPRPVWSRSGRTGGPARRAGWPAGLPSAAIRRPLPANVTAR